MKDDTLAIYKVQTKTCEFGMTFPQIHYYTWLELRREMLARRKERIKVIKNKMAIYMAVIKGGYTNTKVLPNDLYAKLAELHSEKRNDNFGLYMGNTGFNADLQYYASMCIQELSDYKDRICEDTEWSFNELFEGATIEKYMIDNKSLAQIEKFIQMKS